MNKKTSLFITGLLIFCYFTAMLSITIAWLKSGEIPKDEGYFKIAIDAIGICIGFLMIKESIE